MIGQIRILLIPLCGAIVGLLVIVIVWAQQINRQSEANDFYKSSQPTKFTKAGERTIEEREHFVYTYSIDGKSTEFVTRRDLNLPSSGLVRIGTRNGKPNAADQPTASEFLVVVPLDGDDSADTVYESLFDSKPGRHRIEAILISCAGVVLFIISLVIQKKMFGELKKHTIHRHGSRRKGRGRKRSRSH